MVYISSLGLASISRQSTMQAQSDLANVQKELSSGTLADAGLTLGSRSGRLVDFSAAQNKLQTLTDTNALAATRLSATTSALDTLRTAATSYLSTLTTASSTGGSSSLASTAQSSLGALTSALNTSVSGQYIFAGVNTDRAPMTTYVSSPASANKSAVDSAFLTAFGSSQTSPAAAAISGPDMQSFLDGPFAAQFGATSFSSDWSSASDQVATSQISSSQTAQTSVSANQEPFRQLVQAYTMVTEFGGGDLSSSAGQAVISSATTLINQALAGLTSIEAGVGVTQSSISAANDSMASQISLLSTQSSDLDGVDAYDLSTRVSSLQTQIQASYELTAQLNQMSLASYLA